MQHYERQGIRSMQAFRVRASQCGHPTGTLDFSAVGLRQAVLETQNSTRNTMLRASVLCGTAGSHRALLSLDLDMHAATRHLGFSLFILYVHLMVAVM